MPLSDPFDVGYRGIVDPTIITLKHTNLTTDDVGKAVKLTDSLTVGLCVNDDLPFGQISNVETGIVGVKIHGVFEFKYSGTAPAIGLEKLASDADGIVKASATGKEVQVIHVDASTNTVVFIA